MAQEELTRKDMCSLPQNAMRPLKEGEVYEPLMGADQRPREVTTWSVTWGLLMAVLFSAAAAYLGLKVGQVFEAAIPIAIIAVGCYLHAASPLHLAGEVPRHCRQLL